MYLENCATEQCVLQSYSCTVNDVQTPEPLHDTKVTNDDTPKSCSDKLNDESNVIGVYCKVDLSQLPPDMIALLPAAHRPLPNDFNLPPLPPWLDIDRLKKGQDFALKYLHGLSYSHSLALLLLFSSEDGLKPLIYTEKSHTPKLAQKRYLSTVLRVKSWLETEIWNPTSEGYKNLKQVRRMHLTVSNRLNGVGVDEVHRHSNLEDKMKSSNGQMLCPLASTLQKDRSLGRNGPSCPVYEKKENRVYLNQMEMAYTQFGFYGLMLLYPNKFVAKPATKEELTNFVHLWRYVGYMLGIEDEFNLCAGDLDTVIQRSLHIVEYFIRPMLLNVNKEWEHMSRCALQGIEKFTKMRINFEATLLYLYWVLSIEAPHLTQYVSWKEMMMFNLTKYVMTKSHKIPGCTQLINYIVKRNVERAEKKEYETK